MPSDDSPDNLEALIDDKTAAVFCETIGNPAGNIVDIEAIAAMAHKHGVPLIVDNTVATPSLIKPIEYGADIVVHSLTKYMGGHGTSLGGVIVDSGNFPWAEHAARFPMLSKPEPSYHGVVYTEALGAGGLHRPCPHRAAAQHRRGHQPLQRLPHSAGHRNAAPAHGAPLRQRPGGRQLAGGA